MRRKQDSMSKKLPVFKTDEEAEAFLEQDDLSEYITPENFTPAQINFSAARYEELPKTENVHMRFSKALLDAVKDKAKEQGVNYQKYIRRAVEISLQEHQQP